MKLFLVSPHDEFEDDVRHILEQKFSGDYIQLEDRESFLCVLATPSDLTPGAVSRMLNFTSTKSEEFNSGIVIEIADYFGYDYKELWQQMKAWKNE